MKLNMKKAGLICLSSVLMLCGIFVAAGCSKKNVDGGISKSGILKDKIKVVTTVYPVYEWTKAVAGDAADVELLIKGGTDLHSFTPSAKDIISVTGKDTDLFIYIGGESDFWIEKLQDKMKANGVESLNLMQVKNSGLIAEEEHHHHHHDGEHCEDCDDDDDHDHEHEHADHEHEDCDHDHEEVEYDEHVWMSLMLASGFVDCICEKMCEVDSENAERVSLYRKNAADYKAKLDELDMNFAAVTEKFVLKEAPEYELDLTIIVADRNPFVYLAKDYGLNIVAAFHGCSAETEASFETVMKLAHEADEHNVKAIVITETGNDKIAKTVIENCKNKDLKIVTLNAMQGKMRKDETYLSVMEENLKVIKGLDFHRGYYK